MSAAIDGLKYKIYQCNLNIGSSEADKRKLEKKQSELSAKSNSLVVDLAEAKGRLMEAQQSANFEIKETKRILRRKGQQRVSAVYA